MSASDFIASLALLGAAFAAILAWRTSSKANRLQQRVVDLEEIRERDRLADQRRANLVAGFEIAGRSAELVVMNSGRSEARDVRVLVDSKTLDQHRVFLNWYRPGPGLIGPGGRIGFNMSVYDGMQRTFAVEVHWSDDSAENRVWSSTLSL